MTRKRNKWVEARIALTEMGLVEPVIDKHGQIVMRDGEIVWRISDKGREELARHGIEPTRQE